MTPSKEALLPDEMYLGTDWIQINNKPYIACDTIHQPGFIKFTRAHPAASEGVVEKVRIYVTQVATCQKQNTDEWMQYIAECSNEILKTVGKSEYEVSVNARGNLSIAKLSARGVEE